MSRVTNLKDTVLAAATFAGLSLPVCAADTSGVNAAATAGGQGGVVADLSMAQALYSYGVANKDALSVLAAARIAGSIAPEDVAREVETKPTEGVDITEDCEGVDAPVEAEAMLAMAMAMDLAGGDPAITGMIEDAQAEGSRGRVGDASRTLSRLRAGHTEIFRVNFRGDSLAEIAILGDGDLDLLVTDEKGNTICLDRSYSDRLYCSFTPA